MYDTGGVIIEIALKKNVKPICMRLFTTLLKILFFFSTTLAQKKKMKKDSSTTSTKIFSDVRSRRVHMRCFYAFKYNRNGGISYFEYRVCTLIITNTNLTGIVER